MLMEPTINQSTDALPPPIFILGMMPRTGTHFLGNLLCLHPDCAKSVLTEDMMIHYADSLAGYAKTLQRCWERGMINGCPATEDELLESLGHGLNEFLHRTRRKVAETRARKFNRPPGDGDRNRRLITKAPSVHNLELFFR